MLTKEAFKKLGSPFKLSILPREVESAMVAERVAVFETYSTNTTLMNTEMQKVNNKYLDMDVALPEGLTSFDGKIIPMSDAAKTFLNDNQELGFLSDTKIQREVSTLCIEVTLSNGIKLDGDELAQTRLARALLVMEDTASLSWIALDNKVVQLTKPDVKEAIRLAFEAQSVFFLKDK